MPPQCMRVLMFEIMNDEKARELLLKTCAEFHMQGMKYALDKLIEQKRVAQFDTQRLVRSVLYARLGAGVEEAVSGVGGRAEDMQDFFLELVMAKVLK